MGSRHIVRRRLRWLDRQVIVATLRLERDPRALSHSLCWRGHVGGAKPQFWGETSSGLGCTNTRPLSQSGHVSWVLVGNEAVTEYGSKNTTMQVHKVTCTQHNVHALELDLLLLNTP